jgi:hypothetical protein
VEAAVSEKLLHTVDKLSVFSNSCVYSNISVVLQSWDTMIGFIQKLEMKMAVF